MGTRKGASRPLTATAPIVAAVALSGTMIEWAGEVGDSAPSGPCGLEVWDGHHHHFPGDTKGRTGIG